MYKDFFNLSAEPFRITPDPGFLYLTDQHKEALASIIYGISKRKGFVCITGEVGVGKTTILRSYLDSANEPGLRFIYVFNPNVSFLALLKHIFKELDLRAPTDDIAGMVEALRIFLLENHKKHETLVLLIDEAQNMPINTLESLRMLSNLETSTEKLVQIVLVGQPELEQLLSERQLRQLESRIAIRTRLGPLSSADSASYIRHRLKCVALDDKPAFSEGAIKLIVRRAQGIPRRINVLCDTALMTAFGRKVRPVTAAIVREVLRDMRAEGNGKSRLAALTSRLSWRRAASVGGIAVLGTGVAIGMIASRGQIHPPAAPPLSASVPASAQKIPVASPQPSAAPQHTAVPTGVEPSPPLQVVPAASPPPQAVPAAVPAPKAPQAGGGDSEAVAVPAAPPQAPAAEAPAPRAGDQAAVPTLSIPTPPVIGTTDSPLDDGQDAVRIAAPGDTLAALTAEIYGTADKEHLDWVKSHNPEIVNVDRIHVGQVIAFPAMPAKTDATPRGMP